MAQIVFAALLITVLSFVSAACWRGGQKKLAVGIWISGALAIAAALFALGRQTHIQPHIAIDKVILELESVSETGAGWRLTGTVRNTSELALSEIHGKVTVRLVSADCGSAPCDGFTQQPFKLLMHVGSGQTYPFRIALHDIALPLNEQSDNASSQFLWELEPTSARGYADGHKR